MKLGELVKKPAGPAVRIDESEKALKALVDALADVGVAKTGVIPVAGVVEDKMLAVTVWQQVTYLVRCKPPEVGDKIVDPVERIARTFESEIEAKHITEIRDSTMEDLDRAIPTKSLII